MQFTNRGPQITDNDLREMHGALIFDTSQGCVLLDLISGGVRPLDSEFRLSDSAATPLFVRQHPGLGSVEFWELYDAPQRLVLRMEPAGAVPLVLVPLAGSDHKESELVSATKTLRGWFFAFQAASWVEIVANGESIKRYGSFQGLSTCAATGQLVTFAYESANGEVRVVSQNRTEDWVVHFPSRVSSVFNCFATAPDCIHAIVEMDDRFPCLLYRNATEHSTEPSAPTEDEASWFEGGNPVLAETSVVHVAGRTYWWEVDEPRLLLRTLKLGSSVVENILSLNGISLEPSPRGPALSVDGRYLVAAVYSYDQCVQLVYLVDMTTKALTSFVVEDAIVRHVGAVSL